MCGTSTLSGSSARPKQFTRFAVSSTSTADLKSAELKGFDFRHHAITLICMYVGVFATLYIVYIQPPDCGRERNPTSLLWLWESKSRFGWVSENRDQGIANRERIEKREETLELFFQKRKRFCDRKRIYAFAENKCIHLIINHIHSYNNKSQISTRF